MTPSVATAALSPQLESALNAELVNWPQNNLHEPLRYFLQLGGKRMRPLLCLLSAELYSAPQEHALNAALAIELFHNFTLIHDDIMDQAPLRRGRQTVHTKWNVSGAILSGDALLIRAYQLLARLPESVLQEALILFNRTALEVCEGQQLDMDFEERSHVSRAEYLEMIKLKTSVLLGASVELGALTGGASLSEREHVYQFGIHLGLSFQLMDDWLDFFGNPDQVGKKPGGDVLCGKKTILYILLEESAAPDDKVEAKAMLTEHFGSEQQRLETAQRLYNRYGVSERARELMLHHHSLAMTHLQEIAPRNEAFTELKKLGESLLARAH